MHISKDDDKEEDNDVLLLRRHDNRIFCADIKLHNELRRRTDDWATSPTIVLCSNVDDYRIWTTEKYNIELSKIAICNKRFPIYLGPIEAILN